MVQQQLTVDTGYQRVIESVASIKHFKYFTVNIDIIEGAKPDNGLRLPLFDADRDLVGKNPLHTSTGHPGVLFDLAADHVEIEIENITALFDV